MSKNKSEVLKKKINLAREKLEQIILCDNVLTERSLILSQKLDKLILEYYTIQ